LENIKGDHREERARTIADMQRERMEVEGLKLSVLCEVADGLVEEGKSGAIFLNFTPSMDEVKRDMGQRQSMCTVARR
jgi:hypothetical protein